MTSVYKLLCCALAMLITFSATAQEQSFSWTQSTRGSAGWSTPLEKVATITRAEKLTTTLLVTGILDSLGPGDLHYMKLSIPNYRGVVDGGYSLGALSEFRYGSRSDQIYKSQSGTVDVTDVDPETNIVTGTFNWIGEATLQSQVTLQIRITNGQFKAFVKPTIDLVIQPEDGVKLKPEDEHKMRIIARNKEANEAFIANADISIYHDGTVFEGEKTTTQTTNADGIAEFTFKVKEEPKTGDYTLKVSGRKTGFENSAEVDSKVKIDSTDRYYYTKCKGLPFWEFDAGEGERWEEASGNRIRSSGGRGTMQGIFTFTDITIDTSGGGAKVFASNLVIPDVEFDGGAQDIAILNGVAYVAPACDEVVDFLSEEMLTRISGGRLKKPVFEILGSGFQPNGVKIGATMELGKNKFDGCNDALSGGTVWEPNKKAEASLEMSVQKISDKWVLGGKGSLANWSPAPAWCMKETTIEYKGVESLFSISTKFSCPLFSEAKGALQFRAGALKSVSAEFDLERCIPIPQIPSVCWRGGGLSFDGFDKSPLKGDISAKFGPYDPLKDVYELEFKAGFESAPFKVSGGVTGKVLKFEQISSAKQWQMEVSGTGTLEPGSLKGSLDVTSKALHLGGEYFMDGKMNATLTLSPIGISGTYGGSLTIPNLSPENANKLGKFGKFLAQFTPFPLGSAQTTLMLMGEGKRALTVEYDLSNIAAPPGMPEVMAEAVRKVGKGKLAVDFNLFPNPGAFRFEGGFDALFGGGEITKIGDVVQVSDIPLEATAEMEKLMVFMTNENATVATLVSPSGKTYAATDEADDVWMGATDDGTSQIWVVVNPEEGTWTFKAPTAGDNDEIAAYAKNPDPLFTPTVSVSGDNLNVLWTGQRVASDATVQVYVDDNNSGNDGTLVGEATFVDGALSIPMADSTFPCEFNVYTIVLDDNIGQIDYAPETFSNSTLSIPTPELGVSVADAEGNTTVSWAPFVDPRVTEVAIVDAMSREVLATEFSHVGSAQFQLEGHEQRQLSMVAILAGGQTSCPTLPFNIVTSVNNEPITGTSALGVSVRPHPVTGLSAITIVSDVPGMKHVRIVNIQGELVFEEQIAIVDAVGYDIPVSASQLASGMYTVVVSDNGNVVSHPFVVVQ